MLKRLSALPIDTFLLAIVATVALAALFPARGAFADVMSVATKVVIALLFWLYGTRLSPQQAWRGVKRLQLHLLGFGHHLRGLSAARAGRTRPGSLAAES